MWDARQGRSKLLLNILVAVINSYTINDYNNCIKSLRYIHWVCFSYVKKTEADKVKAEIEKVEQWINQRQANYNIIRSTLNELIELMMFTYRSQFMQVQAEEETEFDVDKVLGFKK